MGRAFLSFISFPLSSFVVICHGKMSLPFRIALRSLFSKRSRYLHSAIGWIAVIGLILGVASQAVALSILGGFEEAFTRSILGFNAHLVLMREGEISDPAEVLKKLKPYENQEGITSKTPFLYREGLLTHHGKVKGAVLKGIDPLTFGSVYDVKLRIFSSSSPGGSLAEVLKNKGSAPPILMGSDLAEYLGVTPDDRMISILSPQGDLKKITDVNNFKRFEVVGTFTSGLYEYDSQFSLIDLNQAQEFFKAPGRITGYEMRVGNLKQAHALADQLGEVFGFPYQLISWDELNSEIFKALKIEKKLFFLIMGLIVAVAAANLIGFIVVLVAGQSKEVSILKAMGLSSRKVGRIFFWQGMILALIGVLVGSGLGWVVSMMLSHYAWITLAKEVYLVSKLPIVLSWTNFLGVLIFSLVISWGATQWATRRVRRLEWDL